MFKAIALVVVSLVFFLGQIGMLLRINDLSRQIGQLNQSPKEEEEEEVRPLTNA
ncbi:MAG: hypothetical protein HY978_03955 [Candidatus Liptonbacteria bacterium]|nr:hypothetical protein [Candidatus Liptonbacteria bacterium]